MKLKGGQAATLGLGSQLSVGWAKKPVDERRIGPTPCSIWEDTQHSTVISQLQHTYIVF